ncbi:hypothetical protein IMCC1989_2849 [gamma proteobacterium IMCC1989]|nr:hypothetical protein IMCC1989_2849 [gamma proteobacterium IMCC1989]
MKNKSTRAISGVSHAAVCKVAVKLFFAISDEWELTDVQKCTLAGVSTRSTLHNWKRKVEGGDDVALSKDALERLSYISGIYKGVQGLYSSPKQWKEWVKKPNRDFAGKSALDRMLCGRVIDLADVRRYIDAWRGDVYI